MFFAEDIGGKRGNFDVREEGTGGGLRKRKSRWAGDKPKPLPTSLPIQLPNFMKELTDVRDYLVPQSLAPILESLFDEYEMWVLRPIYLLG